MFLHIVCKKYSRNKTLEQPQVLHITINSFQLENSKQIFMKMNYCQGASDFAERFGFLYLLAINQT